MILWKFKNIFSKYRVSHNSCLGPPKSQIPAVKRFVKCSANWIFWKSWSFEFIKFYLFRVFCYFQFSEILSEIISRAVSELAILFYFSENLKLLKKLKTVFFQLFEKKSVAELFRKRSTSGICILGGPRHELWDTL